MNPSSGEEGFRLKSFSEKSQRTSRPKRGTGQREVRGEKGNEPPKTLRALCSVQNKET